MEPDFDRETPQERERRLLDMIQASVEMQQEGLRKYCFEIKYGKIHLN
jgi:hypothetical protein